MQLIAHDDYCLDSSLLLRQTLPVSSLDWFWAMWEIGKTYTFTKQENLNVELLSIAEQELKETTV